MAMASGGLSGSVWKDGLFYGYSLEDWNLGRLSRSGPRKIVRKEQLATETDENRIEQKDDGQKENEEYRHRLFFSRVWFRMQKAIIPAGSKQENEWQGHHPQKQKRNDL